MVPSPSVGPTPAASSGASPPPPASPGSPGITPSPSASSECMSGTTASTDVVVVGAGPAGAATAILLARRGHRVTLFDRARFPRDKVCGEYLSPEASRILDRLGVLEAVEHAGARPLRGMRVTAPDGTQ